MTFFRDKQSDAVFTKTNTCTGHKMITNLLSPPESLTAIDPTPLFRPGKLGLSKPQCLVSEAFAAMASVPETKHILVLVVSLSLPTAMTAFQFIGNDRKLWRISLENIEKDPGGMK